MADKKFVGVNPELFTELTQEDINNPEWLVEIDGQLIPYRQGARFFNPKRGLEWRLGRRTDGYVGVIGHEPGGGGSVIVPYVIADSELWIGLIEEPRKTQGGKTFNLPRGYLDPGETHFETAEREMYEETGVKITRNRIKALVGLSNPNSANYDTSRENEGVRFYAVEFFSPEEVERVSISGDYTDALAFRKNIILPKEDDAVAKKVFSCLFYPWDMAASVSDQFTNAGVARLLKSLKYYNKDKKRTEVKIVVS